MSVLHRSIYKPVELTDTLKRAGLTMLCLGATGLSLFVFHGYYPIQSWLFWRLAGIWLWELLFVGACLSTGHLLLTRALAIRDLPGLESAVSSMALGVVAFVLTMFAGGALGLFRPWFAIALPVVMLLIGAPAAISPLRKLRSALSVPNRVAPLAGVLWAAGALCVAVVYLPLLTPDALNFDATWFHVTTAQDYAREGRIVPFMADWAKNLPQLTSVLHTWAFLVPGLATPLRWIMVLHTEFVLFLWTLAGIVPAVRWLARREGCSAAWATFFLFPAVFIYDSNLGGAADHIIAFFALPLLLAALRSVERPDPRMAVLAGVMAGAGLLTKFQAAYLVVPLGLLMVVRAAAASFRVNGTEERVLRRGAWLSVAFYGVGALAVLSPHLIKNQLFHGNPVYPFLMGTISTSRPVIPDGDRLFHDVLSHAGGGPVMDALPLPFTFWAKLVDYDHMPFVGAAFCLLLPVSLFVAGRRLWAAMFVGVAALAGWAFGFPSSRNIQNFLPVLVAITGAIVVLAWERGLAVRVAVGLLVAGQVVWGADELFSSQAGRVSAAMGLLSSGRQGRAGQRFKNFRAPHRDIARALPRDAVVLIHRGCDELGIDRPVLLDFMGFQGLIDYRSMRTAGDVHRRLSEAGVTHIVVSPGSPTPTRQEEVLFDSFLLGYATRLGSFGAGELWKMPAAPPPEERPYQVLSWGLSGILDGVYRVESLGEAGPDAPDCGFKDVRSALSRMNELDALILGPGAQPEPSIQSRIDSRFQRVKYPGFSVYVRRR